MQDITKFISDSLQTLASSLIKGVLQSKIYRIHARQAMISLLNYVGQATNIITNLTTKIIFKLSLYATWLRMKLTLPARGECFTQHSVVKCIESMRALLAEPMRTIIIIWLIYLAFKAFKTRTKNLAGIFITPALFTILAIKLALKYYALNFLDLFVWIFSTIIFSLIGYLSINQGQIKYDTLNETFRLLGSKFNLAFTILILLANYYLNYQLTTNPINLYLITLLSLNNSLFGLFIGRWLAYVIYTDKLSTD